MNKKMRLTWQRLIADRKRFGLFCMLLFVGLLLWARIIVIARPSRTAVAEPMVEASVATLVAAKRIAIPVVFETHPVKNPFVISDVSFPSQYTTTDNTSTQSTNGGVKAEQDIVDGLTLEAIMGKMAMINGRVIQQGEVVFVQNIPDPLRLVELSGRSVIISAGNRRYELTIVPPRR